VIPVLRQLLDPLIQSEQGTSLNRAGVVHPSPPPPLAWTTIGHLRRRTIARRAASTAVPRSRRTRSPRSLRRDVLVLAVRASYFRLSVRRHVSPASSLPGRRAKRSSSIFRRVDQSCLHLSGGPRTVVAEPRVPIVLSVADGRDQSRRRSCPIPFLDVANSVVGVGVDIEAARRGNPRRPGRPSG
jgi:hypothetical protein